MAGLYIPISQWLGSIESPNGLPICDPAVIKLPVPILQKDRGSSTEGLFEEKKAPAGMYTGIPDFLREKRPLRACTQEFRTFEEKKAPAGMYTGAPDF